MSMKLLNDEYKIRNLYIYCSKYRKYITVIKCNTCCNLKSILNLNNTFIQCNFKKKKKYE